MGKLEKLKTDQNGLPATSVKDLAEPTATSKALNFALDTWDLPRIDLKDPNSVSERIRYYFQNCVDRDIKPTVEGVSLYLGIDRAQFYNLRNGDPNKEVTQIYLKAFQMINQLTVDFMQSNQANVVGSIFLLKNNFGYKDESNIKLESAASGEGQLSDEELKNKYKESIADDVIDVEVKPTKKKSKVKRKAS